MTHALEAAPPRLSLAALLAAPLVYALFLLSSWLVKVDEVVLPAVTERPLTRITPQEVIVDGIKPPQVKKDMALADKPPPPPRPAIDTKGMVPAYVPPAPAGGLTIDGFKPGTISVSPIAGRNLQVVRAPAPSIPAAAITRGLSGDCEVFFDVDTRGRPFNLTAQCTDEIFRAEAIRAVGKAEFLPKVNAQGIAVEQHGAIYPLEFRVR